eukprot:767441-Hanusia_phi.AAC.1
MVGKLLCCHVANASLYLCDRVLLSCLVRPILSSSPLVPSSRLLLSCSPLLPLLLCFRSRRLRQVNRAGPQVSCTRPGAAADAGQVRSHPHGRPDASDGRLGGNETHQGVGEGQRKKAVPCS